MDAAPPTGRGIKEYTEPLSQDSAISAARPVAGLRPHSLVATVLAKTTQEAVAALQRIPPEVGLAEVRLDGLWPSVPNEDLAADDLLALADAARTPMLATLRPKRQGGRFDGPENVRLGLLQSALRAGFSYADLEMDGLDPAGLYTQLHADGGVVASAHLHEVPCRSDGMTALLAMADVPFAYGKLVFPAGAFPDLLRAFELCHADALRGGRPSLATTSHGGAATRALLALAGNRATYGSAPGMPPAVPGQPSVDEILGLWRHWGLGASDLDQCAERPGPWLAVLGTPVGHSLSPRLHNAALRAAGRRERFGALEVPASASALRLLAHVAPRIGLAAASVTAPHKTDAARLSLGDASVQRTGAANALRWDGEQVHSTNTDLTGLRRLLQPDVGPGSTAVVLGSGGAARAAIAALQDLGATVSFASRDPARADAVAKASGATWVPWDHRASLEADAWVQATPLGSQAGDPGPATPTGARVAVELVYAAGPTPFQRDAAKAGARVIDGRTALVAQAEDAYRFWFGQAPDGAAMRQAIGA
jgi:shikimate dehydrogenase